MYLKCPSCSTEINANHISYCVTCLNGGLNASLFKVTADRVIHQAEVDVKLKKTSRSVDAVEAEKKSGPGLIQRLSTSNLAKVLSVAITAAVVTGATLYVYRSLLEVPNGREEVINNLIHTQQLVKAYKRKKKEYPESLSQVITPEEDRPIVNPYSNKEGQGIAWDDMDNVGSQKAKPGIIAYKLVGDDFSIVAYGEDGEPLVGKTGSMIRVTKDTPESALR